LRFTALWTRLRGGESRQVFLSFPQTSGFTEDRIVSSGISLKTLYIYVLRNNEGILTDTLEKRDKKRDDQSLP
jgi:hypothetical protein